MLIKFYLVNKTFNYFLKKFSMKKEKNTTAEGVYDNRNKLNDLTGKEWLKLTSSFWSTEKCADDKIAMNHPAPFLVKDTEKLIKLFTKKDMTVLDPFCGSGTSILAALNLSRKAIGLDLNIEYKKLTIERLRKKNKKEEEDYTYLIGDSRLLLKKLKSDSVQYVVTSPPYHNILKNKTQGTRTDKTEKGFRHGGRVGVNYYSENHNDLGNCETYNEFIKKLSKIMREVYRVLENKKYCTIVISDFTVDKKEINVQGDICNMMISNGFEFSGNTVLLQPNKPLYPFGYPYAYKINHHHQNMLTFRKVAD